MKQANAFIAFRRVIVATTGWIKRDNLLYPIFVFVMLFLLSIFESCIDCESHVPGQLRMIVWAIFQTSVSCVLIASAVGAFGIFAKVLHAFVFAAVAKAFLADLCEVFIQEHFPEEALWNGDLWLMVLKNSSWTEISEFISCNVGMAELLKITALLFALISVFMIVIRLPVSRPNVKSMSASLACVIAFTCCTFLRLPDCDLLAQLLFDSKIPEFKMDKLSFETLVDTGNLVPEPNVFVAMCDKSEQPFGLIVIGESASRCHWSLYGYHRRTTPMMDALRKELVVFSSVRATYWQTIQSMFCMLTGNELKEIKKRYALPAVLKSAGISSSFVSGQSHWGHIDGADAVLFAQCARKTWLSDSNRAGNYWDGNLIDVMRSDLVLTSGVDVCFAHLIGSHLQFTNRYPRELTTFRPDFNDDLTKSCPPHKAAEILAYDNSIAYTDLVLSDMISCVRAARSCSFVLYVSDHGETPETHIRDVSHNGLWEVPMVIWFSEEYRRRFPDVITEVVACKDDEMTNAVVFDLVVKLLRIRVVGLK